MRSWRDLAAGLEKWGYPGPHKLWSIIILATELIGGPLLLLGLFTRPVAVPIFILLAMSVYDHTRRTAGSGTHPRRRVSADLVARRRSIS